MSPNLTLTRVTVPIAYKDPSMAIISTLKKEWVSKGLTQDQINSKSIAFSEEWKNRKNTMVVSSLANKLVGHSAQKVYLIDLGNLTDSVMSAIPEYLKQRIEWVDRNKKIQRQISEMLEPIYEDINPFWEKIRKQTGADPGSLEGHEHGVCMLYEFLTTVTVAFKYETEADIDYGIVQTAVDRIKRQISSPLALSLISRIDGLLNCYQSFNDVPYIYATNSNVTHDLMRDLLEDSKMISLSKSRYLLGIPSRIEYSIIKVRQKTRELVVSPKNRKNFAMASKIGNMATKQLNVELPEFDVERRKEFAPPLISLDEIKPACLRTRRLFTES